MILKIEGTDLIIDTALALGGGPWATVWRIGKDGKVIRPFLAYYTGAASRDEAITFCEEIMERKGGEDDHANS